VSITVVDAVVRIKDETQDALGGLASLSASLIGIGALAGGAVAGAFIKMGMDAQTQLAIVQGLAGVSQAQMQGYTSALEDMGAQLGSTLDESAKGLYYVVSAGFKGADAMNILNYSMMAAKASGADLADVTHGVAGALNAYGAGADQAGKYTDIMTAAVVDGMQTYADFSHYVGNATAVAAAHGVSLITLAAAESSLTQRAWKPRPRFKG
jgi:TP901 family phage tail tape measure protein